MSDVRRLAEEVRERHEHIDVLANNAGALFATRGVTSRDSSGSLPSITSHRSC